MEIDTKSKSRFWVKISSYEYKDICINNFPLLTHATALITHINISPLNIFITSNLNDFSSLISQLTILILKQLEPSCICFANIAVLSSCISIFNLEWFSRLLLRFDRVGDSVEYKQLGVLVFVNAVQY